MSRHAQVEDRMRSVVRWFLGAALALGVGACATSQEPAPVPVIGGQRDMAALAGEWGGSYESGATGRSGSIVFKLAAGTDSAYGDVVMIPKERRLPAQDPAQGLPIARTPQVLTIAFVHTGAGTVNGRLNPYRDPECDCEVLTAFQGKLKGDVIEGEYTTTRVEGRDTVTGTWKVTRKKP
jgi:hypothetical protein